MPFIAPDPVVAGRTYRVVDGAGCAPTGLDDFLGDRSFAIDLDGTVSTVTGTGRRVDAGVRFHQKDSAGGKDVRVWTINRGDDGIGFTAVT